jgi:hypothetical protein
MQAGLQVAVALIEAKEAAKPLARGPYRHQMVTLALPASD